MTENLLDKIQTYKGANGYAIIALIALGNHYYPFLHRQYWNSVLTGTHLALDEMRSLLVTALVDSSVHFTSNVNSTAQSGQKSAHPQSWQGWEGRRNKESDRNGGGRVMEVEMNTVRCRY